MSFLRGLPQVYGIDAFDTNTAQSHQLGTVGYDALFRRYRYAQAGAVALVKGNLLQSPATTANQFTEGTIVVSVTPGIGQNFAITGHDVTAASGVCTFNIEERVLTALTTSSKVTVTKNPYDGVVQSPAARTGITVGVAITAAAIDGFCWIGVEGQFGVLSDSTVAAVGEGLSPSTTTVGRSEERRVGKECRSR